MRYNEEKTQLLDVGTAPILLEPVVVTLQWKRKGKPRIYVLDHTGNRTGKRVPVRKGKAVLDGRRYGAIYYEIEY